MSSDNDRNLMLGVLALQLNFIDRDQLIAGVTAWATNKSKGLDAILIEQNALAQEHHRALLSMVGSQPVPFDDNASSIHAVNGSEQYHVEALSTLGSVTEELQRIGDPEINGSIAQLVSRVGSVDSHPTRRSQPAGPQRPSSERFNGSRFQILRPHARGGLGEVFVAKDEELNREVALKEIQARHADNMNSRGRFLLEAEVTGGLEHPGIVPVYGLGQYDDGRPYYAMRLIRGISLSEAIEQFHRPEMDSNLNTGQLHFDSVEFRKLLGCFVHVCNAVQYAHSRGVLHRDLKPDNIMLGKFGETLVVDWGLAKLKEQDESLPKAEEAMLQPISGSGSAPTQFGSTLGTPAYMPPEQASGQLDCLGPESDVYSLGATLYQVLTGRAPFCGRNLGEILERVQRGEFDAPRHVEPRIPDALDAICRRAMAFDPNQRYKFPRELAEEVERFLADEPVAAYVEPWSHRAKRWVRKHQTATVTTAVVVVLSTIGLAGFSTVVSSKNSKLAELNQSLIDSNGRERAARKQAETNEELAQLHGQLTFETLAAVVDDIQGGLEGLPGGGEIRRRLLKTALSRLDNIVSTTIEPGRADHQRIWALFKMGDVVLRFGADTPHASEDSSDNPADQELQQSTVSLATKFYNRAHKIALELSDANARDKQTQRDLATSYSKLSSVLLQAGKLEEALDACQRQLEIAQQLQRQFPRDNTVLRDLYVSYHRLGAVQLESALPKPALDSYQQCIEIARTLTDRAPDNAEFARLLAVAYDIVGDAQFRDGNAERALELFQQGLSLKQELQEKQPDAPEMQHDLFVSHIKLGKAQLELGDFQQALESFESSLRVGKRLAAEDPHDLRASRDLTFPLSKIGEIQLKQKQFDAALESYLAVLKIDRESAIADPSDGRIYLDLAISHQNVAEVYEAMENFEAASQTYQEGVAVAQHMINHDMNPKRSQGYLRYFSRSATSAARSSLAYGDWEILLEQPETDQAVLLELRALEAVKRGQIEEAIQAASHLRTRSNVTALQLVSAIRTFRACLAALSTGDLSPEQTQLRNACRSELAQAVKQAATTGFKSLSFPKN